jgi:hypothetical protein
MKDIKDYEGLYSITKTGLVLSHRKKIILKCIKQKTGYLSVTLYKGGKGKTFSIHRLVAETFIDNPKNKPQVNHLDRDRHNNNVENLEWCTSKENSIHSFKNGRVAWNKGKKCKQISESKKGYKNGMARKVLNKRTGTVYETLTEASICLNVPIGTLYSRICRESKINFLEFI